MLKGIPINKRDIHWTKKHERKRAKDEARRKKSQGSKYTLKNAERMYQQARARELTKRAGLWLRFISWKPIVLVRKLIYLIKK